MPKGDLVQNLLDVAARTPATRVLVLTAFADDENVLNAAKGGARGYVSKGVPSATLVQAIKTVHGGSSWVDKEIPSWEAFEEIAAGKRERADRQRHTMRALRL